LNIKLWQCSSSLINFALTKQYKYDLGAFTKYAYLFHRSPTQVQWLINIIDNSDLNFVYSHFADTANPPDLNPSFRWIRPYHQIGRKYTPCQHYAVAGTLYSNKNIIGLLSEYPDSIYFMENAHEQYDNPHIKSLSNQEEYFCNLANSPFFVCEGQTSFLADAFYNGKPATVWPNFNDTECVLNGLVSEKLGLSSCIYDNTEDLYHKEIAPIIHDNISFLHQEIESLIYVSS